MPRLTVVLPIHNGASFLQSAISSVLSQDYDFLLHVLDDVSTDASPEIAQSTGDRRVCYSLNSSRFGLFKTLNRAFREAKTPYVRLWAQDDVMLPNSLSTFMAFADAHRAAGMVYCDFWDIDACGMRTGMEQVFEEQRVRTPEVANAAESALLFYSFGCLPGNISTVMLRRDVWESVGGFLEGFQQAPDYDMWVRLCAVSKIGFIRDKLVELRAHPSQLSKVGHKELTTISEELSIHRALLGALVSVVPRDRLLRFWMHNRGRQHAHWIVRAILKGDFAAARVGWRALAPYGHAWQQFLVWLATGNGRVFAERPKTFYDEFRPCITGTLATEDP